ncbi:hypothetical protein C8J57DRAFT_1373615 [Mycena rebaudengoi]|nr:hypothetical protein C8J57DRAFT_1373615 [Mycena rebaudengoi]
MALSVPRLPFALLLLLAAIPFTAAQSSSSRSVSASATLSADLPSLSGVPVCVTDCMAQAAEAAGCISVAAVDCFCVSPNSTAYTTTFAACLGACPPDAPAAEALVERFCAQAVRSTSLSFPSVRPSSSTSRPVSSSGSPSTTSGSLSTSTMPGTLSSGAPTQTQSGGAIRRRTSGEQRMLGAVGAVGALVVGALAEL